MERRDFFKTCGYACLSGISLTAMATSCSQMKTVSGEIIATDLVLDLNDFHTSQKQLESLIVEHDLLKHPMVVYKLSELEYRAIHLVCSHQGAELQVFGDKLICPAHGAEFTNEGFVYSGPTNLPLRTFKTRIYNNQLFISLQ